MVLVGRWWKFTYDQIRDNSRTKAQSAKTFEKGFLGFCKKSFRVFRYFRIFSQYNFLIAKNRENLFQ